MSRVNAEECWWSDPRRTKLAFAVGSQALADGIALNAWRLAQEFWKRDRQLVPKALFEMIEGSAALIQVNLAEVRDDVVYIRGSSAYLDWINESKETGRIGGKISAQRPRDEKGRLLPKNTQGQSKAPLDETPRVSNGVQPSASASVSDLNKREREEFSKSDLERCIEEWGKTLSHHKIQKDPKFDELNIARLIEEYGFEKTRLALLGARFEEKSKDYDPSKHVNILRLFTLKVFETFVNLGAQNKPATREYYEDDATC